MKAIPVSIFLCLLLVNTSVTQHLQAHNDIQSALTSGRSTGVDLNVNSNGLQVSVFYPDSTNSSKYRMFSSNYPILSFNRPQSLFVIDAMVNVESQLDVEIENIGTASSGVVTVEVKVFHNEYTYFEIINQVTQINQIAGGASGTASVKFTPTYSGNHTLEITATPSISDDDPTNNVGTRFFTVGNRYLNCDSLSSWTVGSNWNLNSDTSISMGTSCHMGNGESSTYPNNLQSALATPVMDLSDSHSNPLRTNGISFYYTGSLAPNDTLKMQAMSPLGAWNDLGTIEGTVDSTFSDGANWLTFSVSDKGATSPVVPVSSEFFHQNTQFRMFFESDQSGNDIGFWFDEFVVLYDQKVRESEYGVSAQGSSSIPSLAGEWGSVRIKVINTGNITETFIPQLNNLPQDWDAYYSRTSGTSFDPLDGVVVTPGQPYEFDLKIKPDANASIGFQQLTLSFTSQQYSSVSTSLNIQFQVIADRIPFIHTPSPRPSCPPTYTCQFEVLIENVGDATDVFDLQIDTSQLPLNWNVQFDWTQSTSVLLRPNQPESVNFSLTIPADASPDTLSNFDFTLSAQNDTRRTITDVVEVAASMMSSAEIDISEEFHDGLIYVDPGESFTITFDIWNNASRQDIFDMHIEAEDVGQWIVHQPSRTNAVLNAGASTSFDVTVEVPTNAQGGDWGPTITPIIQSQRSFMMIEGPQFDRFRVNTYHDVHLEVLTSPQKLTPGVPTGVDVRVTNIGNGDSTVNISFEELPPSWDWWMTDKNGEMIPEHIELTASYDLNDIQELTVWLLLPNEEAAGEFHTLRIVATTIDGTDIDEDDNFIEFTTMTASIRIPELTIGNHSAEVESGGLAYAESLLYNRGNAVDERLSVHAKISVHPPNENIIAFFTINGGDRAMDSDIPLQLLPTEPILLRTELLLPDDLALNSRIVVHYEILGGLDDNGLPYTMTTESMMLVTQKRTLTMEASQSTLEVIGYNSASTFFINVSSESSQQEVMEVELTHPDDWQILCNKILYNNEPLNFSLEIGITIEQVKSIECEARRFGGDLQGQIEISMSTVDGKFQSKESLSLIFEPEPENDNLASSEIALIGGGGIVLLFGLLFILRRRGHNDEDEVHEEMKRQSGPPVQLTSQQEHMHSATVSNQMHHTEQQTTQVHQTNIVQSAQTQSHNPVQVGHPPLPEGGLPAGWTMEQWQYYGQQYLDGTL